MQDFAGLRIVVTGGGTQEPIDPVRVIANRSSGKMGAAFAEAARDRGARVTLISSVESHSPDVTFIPMDTVESLRRAVLSECRSADVLVMAAAVSDFRAGAPSKQKIKKDGGRLLLELVPVDEFMSEVPDRVFKIGFAAETDDLIENARAKFGKYGYDVVCANDVTLPDAGFEVDTNRITVLWPTGETITLPLMSKLEAAGRVLDLCGPTLRERVPRER